MDARPPKPAVSRRSSSKVKGDHVLGHETPESAALRVQRVPKTESQGRRSTLHGHRGRAAEADEVEVEINEGDLRIDVPAAGGPGGQCVNTTDSAAGVTAPAHGSAGPGDQSQPQNKIAAMAVLRARLYEKMLAEQQAAEGAERLAQIGSGDCFWRRSALTTGPRIA